MNLDERLLNRRMMNERREVNALKLLAHGDMRLDVAPRGAVMGLNDLGFARVSTLHALERKRQVERLKGGVFRITDAGRTRAANG